MPAGDFGKEQFRRAIVEFRNLHVVAALGPLFDFRSEVVSNDEFGVRGGLDETTKNHYVEHLLASDRMRRRVTYNPDKMPLGDLIERATDANQTLLGSTQPFGGDEVQEAPGGLITLPWALDGTEILNSRKPREKIQPPSRRQPHRSRRRLTLRLPATQFLCA